MNDDGLRCDCGEVVAVPHAMCRANRPDVDATLPRPQHNTPATDDGPATDARQATVVPESGEDETSETTTGGL